MTSSKPTEPFAPPKRKKLQFKGCKSCFMLANRMDGMRARNRHLVRQLQLERALRARSEQRLRELEETLATYSPQTLAAMLPTRKKPGPKSKNKPANVPWYRQE